MDVPDEHPDAGPHDAGSDDAGSDDAAAAQESARPDAGPDPAVPDAPADAEALVRLVAPVRTVRRQVDPEDWSRSGGDDDERYQRERPPHWE